MRKIRALSQETIKLLKRIESSSHSYKARQRALCIRLSYNNYTLKELSKAFNVTYLTIQRWLTRWEDEGFPGLYDRQNGGRKPTFSGKQENQIIAWVKETPKQIKNVLSKIEESWGIVTSKSTIKRILKRNHMTWHRMRKIVGGEPEKADYERKLADLQELKEQDKQGIIDLRYVDESGFSLTPSVPYAWQEKGEYLEIKSQKSKRLNVVGFVNRSNDFESYIFECSINSDVMVACIDGFCKTINKKTVLVMDNASIHTANKLQNKIEKWESLGLTIFFLPTYSPKLNLIEIVWRRIKYKWLQNSDYEDWKTFVKALENILKNIGNQYNIQFA